MDSDVTSVHEQFSFTGKTGEYLRIWIVNVCLTIITLGIYSPWAKVRRLKYLYRSTHLAGGNFDYHASPITILKGRLVGLGALAIYITVSIIMPGLETLIALIVGLFLPWLIVRSRMFQLRNTSYKNIRFSFNNIVGEAVSVIFGIGLLAGITLGAAYPYYKFRRAGLIVSNSRFGNLPFRLDRIISGFYIRYLLALIFLVAAILLTISFTDIVSVFEALDTAETTEEPEINMDTGRHFIQIFIGIFFIIIVVFTMLREALAKLILNNTKVGDHQLICDWSVARLTYIFLTNLLAIGASLGVLIPWATIRMQKYKMQNMSVDTEGQIEDIVAVQSKEVSAMGDEIGEAFDFDLGL